MLESVIRHLIHLKPRVSHNSNGHVHISVEKIRAGNPCGKAEQLKSIKEEATMLPQTDYLSNQLIDAIKRQQEQTQTTEV
jgi:hypothetical protein